MVKKNLTNFPDILYTKYIVTSVQLALDRIYSDGIIKETGLNG